MACGHKVNTFDLSFLWCTLFFALAMINCFKFKLQVRTFQWNIVVIYSSKNCGIGRAFNNNNRLNSFLSSFFFFFTFSLRISFLAIKFNHRHRTRSKNNKLPFVATFHCMRLFSFFVCLCERIAFFTRISRQNFSKWTFGSERSFRTVWKSIHFIDRRQAGRQTIDSAGLTLSHFCWLVFSKFANFFLSLFRFSFEISLSFKLS